MRIVDDVDQIEANHSDVILLPGDNQDDLDHMTLFNKLGLFLPTDDDATGINYEDLTDDDNSVQALEPETDMDAENEDAEYDVGNVVMNKPGTS